MGSSNEKVNQFTNFLFEKSFGYVKGDIPEELIERAFISTLEDVRYHFPDISNNEIIDRVISNSNELIIFLYRLGNIIYKQNLNSKLLSHVSFIMKQCCSCEIYFSNSIGKGFYPVHCVGTVVGSRNTIGDGFKIYQCCTIGHTEEENFGAVIGDNFTLYAGSKVLGDVNIGNNVTVGSHSLVLFDMHDNTKCLGIQKKAVKVDKYL